MSKVKVTCHDLTMEFNVPGNRGTLRVLENVSFDVRDGEFLSLVGPSGCGKSTLLRIIAGLLRPTSGAVYIDNKEVSECGSERAFVFQSPLLLPWRTTLRNITYGLELQGVPMKEAVAKAEEVIKLVGLKGFENYYPYNLSGGMQQRVNLARALIMNPSILLMDEPFANLDAQTRVFMQREVLRIWRETRKTIIFVTHQIDEAVFLSDTLVVLSRRPARVISKIDVDLPRPRELELRFKEAFTKYTNQVWELLKREAEKAIEEELAKGML
ncbi:MAG: ABC transporter ATP-binding protein [Candidatus Bathyarchaeia archaeon]